MKTLPVPFLFVGLLSLACFGRTGAAENDSIPRPGFLDGMPCRIVAITDSLRDIERWTFEWYGDRIARMNYFKNGKLKEYAAVEYSDGKISVIRLYDGKDKLFATRELDYAPHGQWIRIRVTPLRGNIKRSIVTATYDGRLRTEVVDETVEGKRYEKRVEKYTYQDGNLVNVVTTVYEAKASSKPSQTTEVEYRNFDQENRAAPLAEFFTTISTPYSSPGKRHALERTVATKGDAKSTWTFELVYEYNAHGLPVLIESFAENSVTGDGYPVQHRTFVWDCE